MEDCWSKHPHLRPSKARTEPKVGTQDNQKSLKCNRCGKYGHSASKCRAKLESIRTVHVQDSTNKIFTSIRGEKEIPYMFGHINGIRCKIGFDSGATNSIISAGMIDKHQLKVEKTDDVLFESAEHNISQGQGFVNATVCTGCISVQMNLYIFNHYTYDILLGDD